MKKKYRELYVTKACCDNKWILWGYKLFWHKLFGKTITLGKFESKEMAESEKLVKT